MRAAPVARLHPDLPCQLAALLPPHPPPSPQGTKPGSDSLVLNRDALDSNVLLRGRGLASVGANRHRGDLVDDVDARRNLPKNRVTRRERRSVAMDDEELASIRVGTRVGHGHDAL